MRTPALGVACLTGLLFSLSGCSGEATPAAATAAPEAAIASQALTAADLPSIRAGRWLMRNVGYQGDQATREMVDEAPEYVCIPAGTNVLSTTSTDLANCPKHAISRRGGAIVVEAQCKADDIESRMTAVYSGDFQSNIKAVIELAMAPSGQPLETVRVTLQGRYEGPCKGDEG